MRTKIVSVRRGGETKREIGLWATHIVLPGQLLSRGVREHQHSAQRRSQPAGTQINLVNLALASSERPEVDVAGLTDAAIQHGWHGDRLHLCQCVVGLRFQMFREVVEFKQEGITELPTDAEAVGHDQRGPSAGSWISIGPAGSPLTCQLERSLAAPATAEWGKRDQRKGRP